MAIEPCRCKTKQIAEETKCHRSGFPMWDGNRWELCSGNCTKEKPCSQEQSDAARAEWDGLKQPGTRQAVVNGVAVAISQVAHFTEAMTRWIKAGKPRTSVEQFQHRKSICESHAGDCFDEKNLQCKVCGCRVVHEQMLFGLLEKPGKLEMSTEACPKGFWQSVYKST